MKLKKEETKKLALSSLMFAILLYGYFNFLLWPLNLSETGQLKAYEVLQPKIAAARGQIAKLQSISKEIPEKQAALKGLLDSLPPREPLSWFPDKIRKIFREQGIVGNVDVRKTAASNIKEYDLFWRYNWNVETTAADFNQIGRLIARIQEDPLIFIQRCNITVEPETPEKHRFQLELSSLVKPL